MDLAQSSLISTRVLRGAVFDMSSHDGRSVEHCDCSARCGHMILAQKVDAAELWASRVRRTLSWLQTRLSSARLPSIASGSALAMIGIAPT